jgi:hypothetical protein
MFVLTGRAEMLCVTRRADCEARSDRALFAMTQY